MNVAAVIGGAALLSFLSDWIERKAVLVEQNCLGPEFRFVVWGWLDHGSYYGRQRFLFIRLPTWKWEYDLFAWPERWCWHQGMVIYKQRKGWELIYVPER